MSYKKKEKRSAWGWVKFSVKSLTCIISLLLFALLIWAAAERIYRGFTDIEYRTPHTVTSTGQCAGVNTDRCVSRIGDGRAVRTKFPAVEGMIIYEQCFIWTDGHVTCDREFERGRWGQMTKEEAMREFESER